MSVPVIRVSSDWLGLREPADAAARSTELAQILAARGAPSAGWTIHDLGAGTGSMSRWLAPRLPGPQRWVLHDRDTDLLRRAHDTTGLRSVDGAPVSVETRETVLGSLTPRDLAGADLITASALLDILTERELVRLTQTCATIGCPILITLSVTGHVELTPPDQLDGAIRDAFNAHQRRPGAEGRLAGPDAPDLAADRFAAMGARVERRPSPWRLDGEDRALAAEWLEGWVGAAVEQQPDLAPDAGAYLKRRLERARAGRLAVSVDHADLLVLPR